MPRYHGGGASEIEALADDLDLSHAVFMWLLPDESDYASTLDEVMKYNPGMRAVYLISTLDGEVLNGGFNQYFYNKGTVLAEETILSLRHIGEDKRADILQQALSAHSAVHQRHEQAKNAGSAKDQLQAFSETCQDNPLRTFDGPYYKAGPDIWQSLAQYIRSHPEEFTSQAP